MKSRRDIAIWAMIALAAAVCAGFGWWSASILERATRSPDPPLAWTKESVAETQRRGGRIAAALHAYHGAEGAYPAELGLLVSEFLPEIEPPIIGDGAWSYSIVGDGSNFILSVAQPPDGYPMMFYESAKGRWLFDG